jgi:hypothetical protein
MRVLCQLNMAHPLLLYLLQVLQSGPCLWLLQIVLAHHPPPAQEVVKCCQVCQVSCKAPCQALCLPQLQTQQAQTPPYQLLPQDLLR